VQIKQSFENKNTVVTLNPAFAGNSHPVKEIQLNGMW